MNHILKKVTLILTCCLLHLGLYAQKYSDKIAPELVQTTKTAEQLECIITFKASANLQDLPTIRGKNQKGRTVYQRLQSTALHSQKQVRQILDKQARSYRSFFITNAIYLKADYDLLLQLAARPEVDFIQANPSIAVLDWQQRAISENSGRSPVEWGLELINVPELWAQGIDGTGVVVGGQDTGVEWTHPTIKEKYRGWIGAEATVEHTHNWFDAIQSFSPLHEGSMVNPCGLSVDFPCDDNNHGTFTMGIMVGDDQQGNQIGVAPGARWIACRNMERGYGSPATYLAGFEWFLAPTDLEGNNPRPDLAPHVINNSWGCPEKEGCTIANWDILKQAIENLRAAGVVVVVSAGNDGPACSTVNNPSAIFANAFAVGATDITDTLANFSSRGPVTVDNSNRLKPDVVAPGVSIRSARRDDKYSVASGTSAAGPFVAGVVALMIQANPLLAGEVSLIEEILKETTVPAYDTISCGGFSTQDIPNPMTGYGRIDALAAVQRAQQVSPTKTFDVDYGIKVYPNPSTGIFYFKSDELLLGHLEIFNAVGNLIQQIQIKESPTQIDLSKQSAGLYYWRWNHQDKISSGKMIVE